METFKTAIQSLSCDNIEYFQIPIEHTKDETFVSTINKLKQHAETIRSRNKIADIIAEQLNVGNLNRFQKRELLCELKRANVVRCHAKFNFCKLKRIANLYVQALQGIIEYNQWLHYAKNDLSQNEISVSKELCTLLNAISDAETEAQNEEKVQEREYRELEASIESVVKEHVITYVHSLGGIEHFINLGNNIVNKQSGDAIKHWCFVASHLKGDVLKDACIYPLQQMSQITK